jgi:hypothetical protein
VPRVPGFKSDTQRQRFADAATLYVRGGALARTCGARLRTGAVCTQLALAGEPRCLRHGGPDAARRFRDRQRAGFKHGSVTPEAWARAEAKRARNALQWAWRKDPRLRGRTIDLGPDEAAFATSATGLGVDVAALYPAVADWLRWRWRRYQRDRVDGTLWQKVVQEDLPRQRATADKAVAWASLGITDRRTVEARAVRTAMRAGDVVRAQAAVDALRAASSAAVDPDGVRAGAAPAGALTGLAVKPWTAGTGADGWKRRLADRVKSPARTPSGPPRPIGRPRRVRTPDCADELAALCDVLRGAGPQVRAMYEAIPRQEDGVAFLRALLAYANAPDDAGAMRRWTGWVNALR